LSIMASHNKTRRMCNLLLESTVRPVTGRPGLTPMCTGIQENE